MSSAEMTRSASARPSIRPSLRPDGSPASVDVGDLLRTPYANAKAAAIARFNEVYLGELMKRTSGSLSEAARQSGLDRSNFRRLLKTVKGGGGETDT